MVTVNVPWNEKANTTPIWNNICANVVEHFGLPGGKYKTEVSVDGMKFHFHNEFDALMCKLLISENV